MNYHHLQKKRMIISGVILSLISCLSVISIINPISEILFLGLLRVMIFIGIIIFSYVVLSSPFILISVIAVICDRYWGKPQDEQSLELQRIVMERYANRNRKKYPKYAR